jgi:hypothetical protein
MYLCLQSIKLVPETARSWCSDTYQTPSNDGGQNITVKVEEGLEPEEGEVLVPISFPDIKTESEVSCVSVFSLLLMPC